MKKVFLKISQNSQENTFVIKTTYFYRTSLVAAAGLSDSTNVPTTANQFTRFYMKGKLVFFNSFMTEVPII